MKWRLIISCLIAISTGMSAKIKEGIYRGVLFLDESKGIELPFNFSVKTQGKRIVMLIQNGDERIRVDEITQKGDSLIIKMPVFDTGFKVVVLPDGGWQGVWINHYRKEKKEIPFKAVYGVSWRFPSSAPSSSTAAFEGQWETTFSPQTPDSSKAIGIFHHQEQTPFVTGTFLTETGDYRYLEGLADGNTLRLSCFDGSHAFLFIAQKETNGTLKGDFYSGAHWHEFWEAVKNPDFKLREAEEITTIAHPEQPLAFAYPDLNGKEVKLSDKRFEGKPVIIQLMGSWCPNCMDESAYLSSVYKQYGSQGLEIVALAYERTTDREKAKLQVSRLVKRFNMTYPVLLTGLSGKDQAWASMPFLNKVSAFPTTLFLNKEHKVVKIHTGFSGPATGREYEKFKEETERLINRLIHE